MRLSARGAKFIAAKEGCELHVYDDGAGNPTIGVGHTDKVTFGTRPITHEQAIKYLQHDAGDSMRAIARAVDDKVLRGLEQHQKDMLISLTFNIGGGAFAGSTVCRELNRRHFRKAADAMLIWNKVNGQAWIGLARRRHAERRVFLHGYKRHD